MPSNRRQGTPSLSSFLHLARLLTLLERPLLTHFATDAGANLTSAVVDRVDFTDANLKGAKFINAVVTGCNFDRADLSGISFEDALVGGEDVKRM